MAELRLSSSQHSQLETDGAVQVPIPGPFTDISALFDALSHKTPGHRLYSLPDALHAFLSRSGPLGQLAQESLSPNARPVRVLLFDKTSEANWSVPWHQDRTIAVKQRCDLEGFTVWSNKQGIPHVEPPFDVLERMVTLRLHLDETGPDNAPLLTAKGTHRLGKVQAEEANRLAQRHDIIEHTAPEGTVLILRTPILHASHRANQPQRRRVLHVDYSDYPLPAPLHWALDWCEAER